MEENAKKPWGLQWRMSKTFIIVVVDFSVFMDIVLYGVLVTPGSAIAPRLSQYVGSGVSLCLE
jgi:hypothetical protein